jgi:DNA polymerase-4
VLEQFAPIVEGASIDEWYLDLGGTESLYHHEPLARTAERIRHAVHDATGLTVSIGGGTNKLIAKLAVEHAKPKYGATGVHVVPAGDEAAFVQGVQLADIPMVGPKFQERLATLGMTSAAHVLQYDLTTLERWLGARDARWLYDRVRGVDDRPVRPRTETKSISRDETFPRDLDDDDALESELLRLVTRAAADLRGDGIVARTITVRVRDHDFKNRSAARTLDEPVMSDRVIYAEARVLFRKLRASRRAPIRLLGVALSSLAANPNDDQFQLFEGDTKRVGANDELHETEKDRALARTVDQLRAKFGAHAVLPGKLR